MLVNPELPGRFSSESYGKYFNFNNRPAVTDFRLICTGNTFKQRSSTGNVDIRCCRIQPNHLKNKD
jgi:hypothetical protein